MPSQHDIPGVCKDFQMKRFPERTELMRKMADFMNAPEVKLLLAEIGEHAVELKQSPLQLLALGFTYGATVGILAEKYRRRVIDG
jgi:hypothetical protein